MAVMTPGINEKHDLAGALDLSTGTLLHGLGARKTPALFRELWAALDKAYPALPSQRVDVVVDHDKIHKVKAHSCPLKRILALKPGICEFERSRYT